MAHNRKAIITKFAHKKNFYIGGIDLTKISKDMKNLREKEIKRLYNLYVDVKMNYQKGIKMFLVLSCIIRKKDALKVLHQIFAKRLVSNINRFVLTFF